MNQQNSPTSAPTSANTNTQQYTLTPSTETDPVVITVQNELSGAQWFSRFPTSKQTSDLRSPFRENTENFIEALEAAGANVDISATRRPKERAFLMHWSWKIVKQGYDPRNVPDYPGGGINIKWDHTFDNGQYNASASVQAALDMVTLYQIFNLQVAPSLTTKHITGTAIDMTINWQGNLTINRANGSIETIETLPRDGMNQKLKEIGAGYNVMKFVGGIADRPHWPDNGH